MRAHDDVLCQAQVPNVAHVLLDGLACHYRLLADGQRQITAVLMPGDICDFEALFTNEARYNVGTLTECRLGEIALPTSGDIDDIDPELRQVLWRQMLRDEAILREWIVGLGRRTALERLAHLFCEFWTRMQAVNLADEGGCDLPLRQVDIADILGLSNVHMNRSLQELRATGLVQFHSSRLDIRDHRGLARLADFDPSYLRFS